MVWMKAPPRHKSTSTLMLNLRYRSGHVYAENEALSFTGLASSSANIAEVKLLRNE